MSDAANGVPPPPPETGDPHQSYSAWYAAYGQYQGYPPPAPGYPGEYPPQLYNYQPSAAAAAPTPGAPPPPPPSAGSAQQGGTTTTAAAGAAPPPPPPGAAGSYDYSQQYYGGQQHYNYPGYNYSNYYQQQHPGYPPPAAPPPYTAPYPKPPPPKSAPPPEAAQPPQTNKTSQQQQQWDGSYNAVPPPSYLSLPAGRGRDRGASHTGASTAPPYVIKSQVPKSKQQGQAPPDLLSKFQAAAAAVSAGLNPSVQARGGASQQPSYRSVGGGPSGSLQRPSSGVGANQGGSKAAPVMVPPQQWPPALKAYVERAFKAATSSQRSRLQDVLKIVIADAQAQGELWTRDWDTLPLPDLTQSVADAAAIVSQVASVSNTAAVGGNSGGLQYGQAAVNRQAPWSNLSTSGQQQQPYSYSAGRKGNAWDANNRSNYHTSGPITTQELRKKRRYNEESNEDQSARYEEEQRKQQRGNRFGDGVAQGAKKIGSNDNYAAKRRRRVELYTEEVDSEEEIDWNQFAIKGTCQELEKSYFRLTSAPHPSTVRPEKVLKKALDRLVKMVASKEVNYFYAQDQFKGMRQDCVIQNIRGELAVRVYEAHARAALEYGDVAEYNQCQSQVATLYAEGAPSENRKEFLAYRILYQTVHSRHGEALQLLNTLKKVTTDDRKDPGVDHALKVRRAWCTADYAAFFMLYGSAPRLGRALMDIAVPTIRFNALTVVVKVFRPSLNADFVASLLGFIVKQKSNAGGGEDGAPTDDHVEEGENPGSAAANKSKKKKSSSSVVMVIPKRQASQPLPGCSEVTYEGKHAAKTDTAQGMAECIAWLSECGAVVNGEGNAAGGELVIDCKASELHKPEDKQAVAHGDANLDIGDFLKSFS